MLGGVRLGSGLTGQLGSAWVVHGIGAWHVHGCMVVLVMLCGGWIKGIRVIDIETSTVFLNFRTAYTTRTEHAHTHSHLASNGHI